MSLLSVLTRRRREKATGMYLPVNPRRGAKKKKERLPTQLDGAHQRVRAALGIQKGRWPRDLDLCERRGSGAEESGSGHFELF